MKELALKLALVIVAVLAPIHAMLIVVGILIVADMVTGVWAAFKRGERVNSASLRRTISKFVIYNIAVISGFLLERYLLSDIFPVSKIVAGVIGLVEFTSIMENLGSISGQNVFKLIITKLGSQNDLVKQVIESKVTESTITELKTTVVVQTMDKKD